MTRFGFVVLGMVFGGAFSSALADEQVARVTQLAGRAQLFTSPAKAPHPGKSTADGTMALFEGEYFLVKEAKVGDPIEHGNIVRTLLGSRVRVIYPNGDQFMVGPGTAYRVFWDKKAVAKARIELMYGKIRAVVSKDGPRGRFSLRTKAATLGVRGTDFYVAESPASGETEVVVVRGAVEVQSTLAKTDTAVVKMGSSATIATTQATPAELPASPAPESSAKPSLIALRTTSKEEFAGVQKASKISAAEDSGDGTAKPVDPKTETLVKTLERKAIETTANDIARYQPGLHAKLAPELKQVRSVEELHEKAVENLSKDAPSVPKKRKKPSRSELDSGGDEDPYQKYFKIGN